MEQSDPCVVAIAHFASGISVTVTRIKTLNGNIPVSSHRPDNDNFNSPDPCPIDTYPIDAESNTARFGTAMLSRLVDRLAAMNP